MLYEELGWPCLYHSSWVSATAIVAVRGTAELPRQLGQCHRQRYASKGTPQVSHVGHLQHQVGGGVGGGEMVGSLGGGLEVVGSLGDGWIVGHRPTLCDECCHTNI